jgi:hypothetical protein
MVDRYRSGCDTGLKRWLTKGKERPPFAKGERDGAQGKCRFLDSAEEISFDSLRSLRTPILVGSSARIGMTGRWFRMVDRVSVGSG